MPSYIKDEEKWEKAKKIVKKEYDYSQKDDNFWALVMKIYKNMDGKFKKKKRLRKKTSKKINKILYHASKVQGLKEIIPKTANAYKEEGDVVFASSNPSFAAVFGTYWTDNDVQITTYSNEEFEEPNENNVFKISFDILNPLKIKFNEPCSIYKIEGEFEYLRYENDLEQISRKKCKVIEEKKFNTFKEMLDFFKVQINYI